MKELAKHLKVVPTHDGSLSIHNSIYDEATHSVHGAMEETLLHYVAGTQVIEKLNLLGEIHILEIGFATGLGLKATIEEVHKNEITRPVNYYAVELDLPTIHWGLDNTIVFNKVLREYAQLDKDKLNIKINNFTITVLIGDARRTLPKLYNENPSIKFDCIYQDAFSPKRNPQLWSIEWFKMLRCFANNDCIMSTYSASSSIRKAMIEANWSLYNGVKFGHKRASTRATINKETAPEILDQLSRSPAQPWQEEDLELRGILHAIK